MEENINAVAAQVAVKEVKEEYTTLRIKKSVRDKLKAISEKDESLSDTLERILKGLVI